MAGASEKVEPLGETAKVPWGWGRQRTLRRRDLHRGKHWGNSEAKAKRQERASEDENKGAEWP